MAAVEPLEMGRPITGNPIILSFLQSVAERDSGIDDLRLGLGGALKSAVPATNVLATLQEGNSKPDATIRDMRAEYGKMGLMALSDYQQFNPTGKVFSYLDEDKGRLVDALFRLPIQQIQTGLAVELTATSAALSREIKKQNSVTVNSMIFQYYEKVIQLGQLLQESQQGAPGLPPETIAKIMTKSGDMFVRFLDDMEVPDSDQFIIGMEDIIGSQQGTANLPPQVSGLADAAGGVPDVG